MPLVSVEIEVRKDGVAQRHFREIELPMEAQEFTQIIRQRPDGARITITPLQWPKL